MPCTPHTVTFSSTTGCICRPLENYNSTFRDHLSGALVSSSCCRHLWVALFMVGFTRLPLLSTAFSTLFNVIFLSLWLFSRQTTMQCLVYSLHDCHAQQMGENSTCSKHATMAVKQTCTYHTNKVMINITYIKARFAIFALLKNHINYVKLC